MNFAKLMTFTKMDRGLGLPRKPCKKTPCIYLTGKVVQKAMHLLVFFV